MDIFDESLLKHLCMTNFFKFEKIILVDDNILLNMKHRKILQIIGFSGEVMAFNNGLLAINYINKEIGINAEFNIIPTLIILDLEMAVLNGWGFLKRFEELEAELIKCFYVVVSSSSFDSFDFNMDMEFKSVKEYIPKPLSINTIKRLIEGEKV